MPPNTPDIDDSYFVNRYLTQTIEDYKEIIKLLRNNNTLSSNIADSLEQSVQELSTVSSNSSSINDLNATQQKALGSIIGQTRVIQKKYNTIRTNATSKKQQRSAESTWQAIMKGAKHIHMLNGTLQKDIKYLHPSALKGSLTSKQSQNIYEENVNEYKTNQDIKSKAQQLKQQTIYPPAPKPPNKMLKRPGQTNDDDSSWKDKALLTVAQISKGVGEFLSGLANFVSGLGQAYQAMMDAFGNILDSPLEQTVGMLQGMGQMVSQGYQMVQTLFSSVASALTGILSVFTGSGDESSNKTSAVTAVVNQLVGVVTALFEIAIQAIQAGFNIFASTLQAIFKIVKKISESSPIIRQILDLLSLAFNLFFMPFMNQFGLALLEHVIALLDWAVTTGEAFSQKGQEIAELLMSQGISIEDILQFVENIAVKFVEDYLPKILDLIPSIVDFANAFVSSILNNKEDLIGFIQQGLSAFKQLIDAGILPTFLDLGKKVMSWINDNADTIVTFIAKVLNAQLNIAKWFTGFFKTDFDVSNRPLGGMTNPGSVVAGFQTDIVLDQFGDSGDADAINQNYQSATAQDAQKEWTGPTQAKGGIFHHAYNGGIPVLAGEANEAEYRFSEKELKEIGKDTTVVVQYQGSIMSTGDFKQMVRSTVSDVSNKSYFR